MRYETAAAFRTALEQRLRDRALSAGLPLDVLRKRVVFERFLARLLWTWPEDWRLKGALALEFRLQDHARFTRDLDLVHEAGEERAEEGLRQAGLSRRASVRRGTARRQVPGPAWMEAGSWLREEAPSDDAR